MRRIFGALDLWCVESLVRWIFGALDLWCIESWMGQGPDWSLKKQGDSSQRSKLARFIN